jgi:hypothetical protein
MSEIKFKLSFLLKALAVSTISVLLSAFAAENLSSKIYPFLHFSFFGLILDNKFPDLLFMNDTFKGRPFKSKLKTYIQWTIFFQFCFVFYLGSMQFIESQIDIETVEFASAFVFIIFMILYQQLKMIPKYARRVMFQMEQKKIYDQRMERRYECLRLLVDEEYQRFPYFD